MKRWLASGFIASYLGALSWGIVSHAMKFYIFVHPIMYFLVWDMFCGWQAYESRTHVVAEGESGQLYHLSPTPWNEFAPFGNLSRVHYDALGNSYSRLAMTTLKNTTHEPMRRILVVEECWQKKYNLPDPLWAQRYEEPKVPKNYYWLRCQFTPEGELTYTRPDFVGYSYSIQMVENPRLLADARRGRPFFAINPSQRQGGQLVTDPTAWALGGASQNPYAH